MARASSKKEPKTAIQLLDDRAFFKLFHIEGHKITNVLRSAATRYINSSPLPDCLKSSANEVEDRMRLGKLIDASWRLGPNCTQTSLDHAESDRKLAADRWRLDERYLMLADNMGVSRGRTLDALGGRERRHFTLPSGIAVGVDTVTNSILLPFENRERNRYELHLPSEMNEALEAFASGRIKRMQAAAHCLSFFCLLADGAVGRNASTHAYFAMFPWLRPTLLALGVSKTVLDTASVPWRGHDLQYVTLDPKLLAIGEQGVQPILMQMALFNQSSIRSPAPWSVPFPKTNYAHWYTQNVTRWSVKFPDLLSESFDWLAHATD